MVRYCVGIDLGTTNTALAYVECRRGQEGKITTFSIPQLVAPGELSRRALLPSFLYLAGEHDWPDGASALPWDPARRYVVGELAWEQGSRVPGRLVSSAKSWLCHAGVDRQAAILPWNGLPDVARISPVQASARYLQHLVEAWNWTFAQSDAEARLEKQAVVLTIPASFDEMARQLTLEAARQAGLEQVTLLEEPQAAFYAWMASGQCEIFGQDSAPIRRPAEEALQPGMLCVVIDVGGGTTDFSLIEAVEQQGQLGLIRQAVGDHLLLGGDNMDLALARYVEEKLGIAGKLDAVSFFQLAQACRRAKELLLSDKAPPSVPITVIGRGRAVVGSALTSSLTTEEIASVLLDGFLPFTSFDDSPQGAWQLGLHEMGLPYVRDPAISRHLATFLRTFAGSRPPDAILFNGGVFQSARLRQRLVEVMQRWYGSAEHPWQPRVLTNPSMDLAVAWGAAYFSWLRWSGGTRIRSGLARSYYLGIAADLSPTGSSSKADSPSGSVSDTVTVLCVAPRQLDAGIEIQLEKPEMLLALGQPVQFPLFASAVRPQDQAGQILRLARTQLQMLPPLSTVLKGGKRSGAREVPVTVTARLTEIGTLELGLVSRLTHQHWKLEFPLRHISPAQEQEPAEALLANDRAVSETWPDEIVQSAGQAIHDAFSAPDSETVRQLVRQLENVLHTPRDDWPITLCRQLWPFLAQSAACRWRSPEHVARWYNLAGFCLRPGFGNALDNHRVEQLWKLLTVPGKAGGSATLRGTDGGPEYWVLWRRVAGGLSASLQNAIFDRLRLFLLPAKGKSPPYRPNAHELAEMWRAAASLERLPLATRQQLGETLVRQIRRRPWPGYLFWSLARLGSRQTLYGPWNAVIPAHVVSAWIGTLLDLKPLFVLQRNTLTDSGTAKSQATSSDKTAPQELRDWLFCLTQLARRTGIRTLDIEESLRQEVLAQLEQLGAPPDWIHAVREGGQRAAPEAGRFFGDSLPLGLRLAEPVYFSQ